MNLGLAFPNPKARENAKGRTERLDTIDQWLGTTAALESTLDRRSQREQVRPAAESESADGGHT